MCCGLAKHDILKNNAILNLVCKASPGRVARLSILFLGFLFDFALSALFHDNDDSGDSEFFSAENLIANFWIGLYSVLFASIPIAVLGCLFSIKSRSNNRKCLSFIKSFVWLLISVFLGLYIIAFFSLSAWEDQKNWLVSSLISVGLDMVIFEVLPATTLGILGILIYTCKLKCLLCLAVAIEAYRALRNVVGV